VNQLLDRFAEARKVMRQLAGGAGLPPAMARAKAASARKAAKKGKKGASRKGNPAARAAEVQAQRAAAEGRRAPGPPGLPDGFPTDGMPDLSALMRPGAFGGAPPPRSRRGR
jgi:signal recognition particle subunit SRP54